MNAFSQECRMESNAIMQLEVEDFRCQVCGKKSTSMKSLNRHIKTHSNTRHFKCDLCSMEYKRKEYLLRHMRLHTNSKEFSCHLCDKKFICNDYLLRHLKVHTDGKEFKCHLCNKTFILKDYLKKHIRLHMEEKEFQCEVCGKEFSLKVNYKRHLTVHTTLRDFKCNMCGMEFRHSSSLRRHIKKHSGFRSTNNHDLSCGNISMVNCTDIQDNLDELAPESSPEMDSLPVGDEKRSIAKEKVTDFIEVQTTTPSKAPIKMERDEDDELYGKLSLKILEPDVCIKEEVVLDCERT